MLLDSPRERFDACQSAGATLLFKANATGGGMAAGSTPPMSQTASQGGCGASALRSICYPLIIIDFLGLVDKYFV
jgi:hypothetical protein